MHRLHILRALFLTAKHEDDVRKGVGDSKDQLRREYDRVGFQGSSRHWGLAVLLQRLDAARKACKSSPSAVLLGQTSYVLVTGCSS